MSKCYSLLPAVLLQFPLEVPPQHPYLCIQEVHASRRQVASQRKSITFVKYQARPVVKKCKCNHELCYMHHRELHMLPWRSRIEVVRCAHSTSIYSPPVLAVGWGGVHCTWRLCFVLLPIAHRHATWPSHLPEHFKSPINIHMIANQLARDWIGIPEGRGLVGGGQGSNQR